MEERLMGSVKKRLAALTAFVVGAGLSVLPATSASANAPAGGAPSHVVTAYFADWDVYGRNYHVKDIPANQVNVLQYAFGNPTFDPATGAVGCNILDPWADYQQPYTADIAVGDLAATPQRRQAFVSACIDTFIKGNLPGNSWPPSAGGDGAAAGLFDGIDIDWEYPTQIGNGNVDYGPADRHNATLLAVEFRKQLDAYGAITGKHYLLTAALPAATSATKYYELSSISRYLDWDNVMTYDFNVPGGSSAALDTLFK